MPSFWKLKLEQCSNNLHFIVISLVLLAIALIKPLFFILYFIYLIYIFKRKDLISTLKIIVIILGLFFVFSYYKPFLITPSKNIEGLVISKKENKIILLHNFKKYVIYTKDDLAPGDYIKGEILERDLKKPSYSGDFDELMYLKSHDFKGSYKLINYEISRSYKTLGYWRFKALSYYEERMNPFYFSLFSALVFGNNNLDDKLESSLGRLNLLHILALSGFHLNLIYLVFNKFLFSITNKKYLSNRLALGLSFIYALFCGLSISLLRAFLFMYLSYLNSSYKDILTKLDIYSLSFIICLINPLRIYSVSFILSFLSSFIILFMSDFIRTKNSFFKSFYSGIIILMVNFPFITSINNELSLFSLFSFLLMDFFTYFFIPLCFSFLVLPQLSNYLGFITEGFGNFLSLIANSLKITFPYMNFYFSLFYYVILYFILLSLAKGKLKKLLVLFLAILLVCFKLSFRLNTNYLEFVDVGQGDTAYITSDRHNFLIDCYNVLDFLEKRDIRSLDAIFITHSDRDHMGDLPLVLANVRVKRVYINYFDAGIDSICETHGVDLIKLKYYSKLLIGKAEIRVLSPIVELSEKNSNSLVLDIRMLGGSFLFMGDSTIETEALLLENKLLASYDVLKVGHHGSITSTSSAFLEEVRPKAAIISLGKNNYGMPNALVLDRLAKYSKIYITKDSGNITINQRGIKTYRNICYN